MSWSLKLLHNSNKEFIIKLCSAMPVWWVLLWPYRYFDRVVPKLVRAVTQIKVAIMSYYPQYFAVIVHNTEQHCGFGSALPPKESYISPRG